jgi:hypothetical protein
MNRIKNNNPGNIRVGQDWQGEGTPAGPFENFITLADGYRAMFRTLHTYYHTHNKKTIRQIIYRWAPPSDNNPTESYVSTVAAWAGISPDTVLGFEFNQLTRIAAALTRFEHGIGPLTNEENNSMEQGYFMAFPGGLPPLMASTGGGVALLIIISLTFYIFAT